ncbi:hypothetical protein Tco_0322526 [Tanacetum coccineum]
MPEDRACGKVDATPNRVLSLGWQHSEMKNFSPHRPDGTTSQQVIRSSFGSVSLTLSSAADDSLPLGRTHYLVK